MTDKNMSPPPIPHDAYTEVVPSSAPRKTRLSGGGLRLGLLAIYLAGFSLLYWLLPTLLTGLVGVSVTALTFSMLHKNLLRSWGPRPSTRHIPTRVLQKQGERQDRRGALSGEVIGGYELENMIGRGGMSEVYTAQSGGLLLAIKVIDTTISKQYILRFEREVAMLKQAKHPNVVQVFDDGIDGDYAYMVMEYIDGLNLKDYIEKDAPLPLKDVIDIVAGIASAADHIHTVGIIHRDFKPENIMLYWDHNHRCVPMLLDFGVAKQSSRTVITLEGTVGTIEYMSPEQILDAPLVQPSSDVYSIGVMVYEMLTGELPYDGSVAAVVFGHLHGKLKNPRDVNASLPEKMAKAVVKAMAKEPENRYPNLAAFSVALEQGISSRITTKPHP